MRKLGVIALVAASFVAGRLSGPDNTLEAQPRTSDCSEKLQTCERAIAKIASAVDEVKLSPPAASPPVTGAITNAMFMARYRVVGHLLQRHPDSAVQKRYDIVTNNLTNALRHEPLREKFYNILGKLEARLRTRR